MTAAIIAAAIVAAAFMALGAIASRITKREHARVWGLYQEQIDRYLVADLARGKALRERDIALARVEQVLDVLDEGCGTTVSRRKIERAIG